MISPTKEPEAPSEPLPKLFFRFLRFGLLAWGGPVAQIEMVRRELVVEERWITQERFNRVLGVYQALPGPEAHELCVYFGMISRGRVGAVLAGLGFMLPGLLLMLTLSYLYVLYGLSSPVLIAVFLGFQPAVAALIIRASARIGRTALTNRPLWILAAAAAALGLVGTNFLPVLLLISVIYVFLRWRHITTPRKRLWVVAMASAGVAVAALIGFQLWAAATGPIQVPPDTTEPVRPHELILLSLGLKAGLLTFGGAYTAVAIVQEDAVGPGGWMFRSQFLDGLALSGVLPAPFVIFTTFVGYIGGGMTGALLMTVGVFLPAFSFTLVGHNAFERIVANRNAQVALEGVMAAVVGLIASTAILLTLAALTKDGMVDPYSVAILLVSFLPLLIIKSRISVALTVLMGGAMGVLRFLFGI